MKNFGVTLVLSVIGLVIAIVFGLPFSIDFGFINVSPKQPTPLTSYVDESYQGEEEPAIVSVQSGYEEEEITSCPGAPTQKVEVGGLAYICTDVDRVIVRNGPAKSNSVMMRLEPGTQFKVINGPVCSDNWSWWRIRMQDGTVGWISEGGDNEDTYFICPIN
jgi:hypothetical protein